MQYTADLILPTRQQAAPLIKAGQRRTRIFKKPFAFTRGLLLALAVACALPVGAQLVAAVRTMLSQRAAAKAQGALRVRVDPQVVG